MKHKHKGKRMVGIAMWIARFSVGRGVSEVAVGIGAVDVARRVVKVVTVDVEVAEVAESARKISF